MILRILELLLSLFAALFIITQIIIPTIKNTPIFPYYRKSKQDKHKKLRHLREELEEKELDIEIQETDRVLSNLIRSKNIEISRLEDRQSEKVLDKQIKSINETLNNVDN